MRQGATSKKRRSRSEPGWGHRTGKAAPRDHHRVTEMANWGDMPLADQESLRFEGEQELRRSAIVWHWRALEVSKSTVGIPAIYNVPVLDLQL